MCVCECADSALSQRGPPLERLGKVSGNASVHRCVLTCTETPSSIFTFLLNWTKRGRGGVGGVREASIERH
jgi:hypothetical protein